MQQALGRVGRFNDRCKRISVRGVNDFDRAGEQESFGKIVQLAISLNTVQPNIQTKKSNTRKRNGFTTDER